MHFWQRTEGLLKLLELREIRMYRAWLKCVDTQPKLLKVQFVNDLPNQFVSAGSKITLLERHHHEPTMSAVIIDHFMDRTVRRSNECRCLPRCYGLRSTHRTAIEALSGHEGF